MARTLVTQQVRHPKKIDETDAKILDILRKDGRMSTSDIAKRIGLSKTAVKYRLDRLIDRGVIKGFFALVDSEVYGNTLSVVFDLKVQPREIEKVAETVVNLPEVVRTYELTNSPELHVHTLFKSQEEMERWMKEKLYMIPGIEGVNTGIIIKRYKVDVSITI